MLLQTLLSGVVVRQMRLSYAILVAQGLGGPVSLQVVD